MITWWQDLPLWGSGSSGSGIRQHFEALLADHQPPPLVDVLQRQTMGDDRLGVNLALGHEAQGPGHVLRPRVGRAHDAQLAVVEGAAVQDDVGVLPGQAGEEADGPAPGR